jgi:hypothetical protein
MARIAFAGALVVLVALPLHAQARDTSTKVTWGAFVDAYYAWDFGEPASFDRSFASGVLFGTQPARHNEFNVNLAFVEARLDGQRVHGRFALQAGTSVQSNYLGEPAIGTVSGPSLARLIQEAYAGARVSDNLWIDGGIFLSHIGMESWSSRDNVTYTRSLVGDYSPYYEAGVRVALTRGKLASQFVVVNGWQSISENNAGKGVGVRLDYAMSARTTVSYFNLFSDEAGNLLRSYHGLGLRRVAGKTTVVAEGDFGTQAGSAGGATTAWGGGTLMLRQQVRKAFALVGRAERFRDSKQTIVATGVAGAPLDANGVSFGVDATPAPRLLWRTELRFVGNKTAVFSDGGLPSKSNTVAVSSLALKF